MEQGARRALHEIWCMDRMLSLISIHVCSPNEDTDVVGCGLWAYNAQAGRYSALDSQLVCSHALYIAKGHKFDFVSTVLASSATTP